MTRPATRSPARHAVLYVASILVALMGLSACQPEIALLTDARQVLQGALVAGSHLRTATVRMDVEHRDAAQPEVQVDAIVTRMSMAGAADFVRGAWRLEGDAPGGMGRFTTILVDGRTYMQGQAFGDAKRWTAMVQDGGFPAMAILSGGIVGVADVEYGPILSEALASPDVRTELLGVEPCGTSRCYRVGVELPGDASWPLIARLMGLGAMPGLANVPPADVPSLTAAVMADVLDLQPVELQLKLASRMSTATLRLQLTDVNRPVSIVAPPADLVDDMGNLGFGSGIEGDVGFEEDVPPAMAEPIPEPDS